MTPQYIRYTYNKRERIKSLKTIDELFKDGSSFFLTPFKVLYEATPASAPSVKAAFMVSKRNFKTAVERNRIKRMLREAWRLNKHTLLECSISQHYNVIVIFNGQSLPKQQELSMAMIKCIGRIIRELNP